MTFWSADEWYDLGFWSASRASSRSNLWSPRCSRFNHSVDNQLSPSSLHLDASANSITAISRECLWASWCCTFSSQDVCQCPVYQAAPQHSSRRPASALVVNPCFSSCYDRFRRTRASFWLSCCGFGAPFAFWRWESWGLGCWRFLNAALGLFLAWS